ncbi:uncharacterized protein LOC105194412 [Solenopsis invicta]|uniref:uncharacterized protein LOC105194412 n=1 Tax=Solenopsis invicta TaxID=13686 RepID=UPI00193DAAF6|nr:uncharacterized protein LOC105194412 [Solenopsis invicta]
MSRTSYMCLPRDFKMSSTDENIDMEFAFVRENSISQQEKIKAFWKFLDAQNCLQPHEGISERESSSETEMSVPSVEEIMKEKDIWRKGLKVLQHLGLDKTALAADSRCRLCVAHKTIQCKDLADTVTQPYEELNADMEAFEQRQKIRDLNKNEITCTVDKLNEGNSSHIKTKK